MTDPDPRAAETGGADPARDASGDAPSPDVAHAADLTPAARRALLTPAARRALEEARARRERARALDLPPELGGRDGPEPVRYGDWEKKGIAYDF